MTDVFIPAFIGFVIGAMVGWITARLSVQRSAERTRREFQAEVAAVAAGAGPTALADPGLQAIAAALIAARTAEAELTALRQTWQRRRHDVRGALSPALLTADRLTSHGDESVRRAGEIVVQSLQRATEALVDPGSKPGS